MHQDDQNSLKSSWFFTAYFIYITYLIQSVNCYEGQAVYWLYLPAFKNCAGLCQNKLSTCWCYINQNR